MSKQEKTQLPLIKKVRVTKTHDNFNGNHPTGIGEGYSREGFIEKEPTIGESFLVNRLGGYFVTSPVTEIIDGNTFKTENSTYKWEFIGEVPQTLENLI